MSPPTRTNTRQTFKPILPAPRPASHIPNPRVYTPTVTPLQKKLTAPPNVSFFPAEKPIVQKLITPPIHYLPYYPIQHPALLHTNDSNDLRHQIIPPTLHTFLPFINHQEHCQCFFDPLIASQQLLFHTLYSFGLRIDHLVVFVQGEFPPKERDQITNLLTKLQQQTRIPITVAHPNTNPPPPNPTEYKNLKAKTTTL